MKQILPELPFSQYNPSAIPDICHSNPCAFPNIHYALGECAIMVMMNIISIMTILPGQQGGEEVECALR